MGFDFFQVGVENGVTQMPNEAIRERQQATINARWDATTAMYTVQEQDGFGTKTFHDIEVWIDYVVGMSSRGTTNGDDFRQLIFKDIDHPVERGLYYRFDQAVWLTYFMDEFSSLVKDIGVRRCNNALRMIDPENGAIFSVPCVIDYDMTSPAPQVNSNIITPNNHATVMVQGNKDTIRLFKINTRFILGGRAFKLLSYQNALIDKELAIYPTLLYLDLYLDEIQAEDDIENQIAFNGNYNYLITIDNAIKDMEVVNGSTGKLNASVTLNGEEVNRKVCWISSRPEIVDIDDEGNYVVTGKVGHKSIITAYVEGNPCAYDTIAFRVDTKQNIVPNILLDPIFDTIRQYESIEFEIQVGYGDKVITPSKVNITISDEDKSYVKLEPLGNGIFKLTGLKIAKNPIQLNVSVANQNPFFEAESLFTLKAVNMLG